MAQFKQLRHDQYCFATLWHGARRLNPFAPHKFPLSLVFHDCSTVVTGSRPGQGEIMKRYLFPLVLLIGNVAWAINPPEMLAAYETSSGKASIDRGQQFFKGKHGKEWSCSSCHTATPNKVTEHIVTGKRIEPLAPAANAKRFTDLAKSEKWFKRNCKDVLSRECSTQEKADVLAWLLTVK
jgi:hypothetical protein